MSGRSCPRVVVFDLDGVIRDWNDEAMSEVEESYGLEPGVILTTGFGTELGVAAVTGALTYREWMDAIRQRLLAEYGEHVTGALDEWERNVGMVDTEMLSVLRAVRRQCPATLLSNGTTRLRRDLHALDLTDEFDRIFNTAEIGIAKPDPDVFLHVLDELRVSADEALFVDDLEANVEGARSVGIRAHLHTDRDSTVEFFRSHDLPV